MIAVRTHILAFALLFGYMLVGVEFAHGQGAQCPPGALCNPTQFTSITAFVKGVLEVIVMLGIPVISFFLVYAGFLFVKARGGEGPLDKAKKNLMYVLIGTVLILGAWVIATLIGQTVNDLMR